MKLEQQVTSLDLSKKLKQLGVSQQSIFLWVKRTKKAKEKKLGEFGITESRAFLLSQAVVTNPVTFAAFTAAELGEMLPFQIKKYRLATAKNESGGWNIGYWDKINLNPSTISAFGGTEADARGKMLVYLVENNLLKLK